MQLHPQFQSVDESRTLMRGVMGSAKWGTQGSLLLPYPEDRELSPA